MARKSSGGKIVGLLGLVGAALSAWYLLDPKKGKHRREKLATGAKDVYHTAGTELKRVGDGISQGVSSVVDQTGKLVRSVGEKASSGISSAKQNLPSSASEAASSVTKSKSSS